MFNNNPKGALHASCSSRHCMRLFLRLCVEELINLFYQRPTEAAHVGHMQDTNRASYTTNFLEPK
jgi:hypothetical protein